MRPLLLVLLAAAAVSAQPVTPDWDTRPALEDAPAFVPPTVERYTLSNGLEVLFVEKPGVPLVQIDLWAREGGTSYSPDGLARFAADMMDEGAGELDALELADAIDFLGINLSVSAGVEALAVRLHTPLSKLEPALSLMADVALQPTFAESDLERVRTSRITALEQRRDESRDIASDAFVQAVYDGSHPYGTLGNGTPSDLEAITRQDLVRFHSRLQPTQAALVVVGATTWEAVSPRLENAFGADTWPAPDVPGPSLEVPESVVNVNAPLVLVDKPGAAQSVIRIGFDAAQRSTPDYYALEVLNTILGGSFTSRLNQNLRERNGYSYGAGSSFDYRSGGGPFTAFSDVQTDVTALALTEFVREFEAIRERVPETELSKARDFLSLSFPGPFATVRGTAAQVGALWLDRLPLSTYAGYSAGVQSVTADDLERVAAQYFNREQMVFVVVGDRASIEADIRALDLVRSVTPGIDTVEVLSIKDVLGPAPE